MFLLNKDREWAITAHFQRLGLDRPLDWNLVEDDNNEIPRASEIHEHIHEINEDFAKLERVGILEYALAGGGSDISSDDDSEGLYEDGWSGNDESNSEDEWDT